MVRLSECDDALKVAGLLPDIAPLSAWNAVAAPRKYGTGAAAEQIRAFIAEYRATAFSATKISVRFCSAASAPTRLSLSAGTLGGARGLGWEAGPTKWAPLSVSALS
jgi:hypothetical protein